MNGNARIGAILFNGRGPRQRVLTVLIWLALSCSMCRSVAAGSEVYWDISHGVSDQYRPTGRYSVLVDHLAPLGYRFTEGTSPLDTVDLSVYDILVLANGSCASLMFSPAELSAIHTYVRRGGGLLLLSDIAGSSGTAKIQQVADLFGARVGLAKFPPDDVYSTAIGAHPAVAGVGQIYLRYSSSIDPGILTTYAWYNSMPMLAAGEVEWGRVVLIADGDLFTKPPYYPSYFTKADNRQLAESTFGYLVPEPATLSLLALGGMVLIRRKRRQKVVKATKGTGEKGTLYFPTPG